MKKLLRKFEAAMTAITFAEAGEFDTARHYLNEERPRKSGRPRIQKRKEAQVRKEVRAD